MYGLKPVPFKLKPAFFKLKPLPFKLTHYRTLRGGEASGVRDDNGQAGFVVSRVPKAGPGAPHSVAVRSLTSERQFEG